MTLAAAIAVLVAAAMFVRSRPEVLLTAAALVVPSGSFHPSLRVATPIGQLTPFAVAVLTAGLLYVATTPGALSAGLSVAPGVVGATTVVVGGVVAIAAWQVAATYWVISGGLTLVLVSSMLAERYRTAPRTVVVTVAAGGLTSAGSVLIEQALNRHIGWSATDPIPVDFPVFRPSGLAGNSLLASAALAVILAIVITGDLPIRVRALIGAVLVGGIAATLTRSAMIGTALAVAGFLLYRRQRKNAWMTTARLMVFFVGIPVGIAYYLARSSLISERLGGSSWGNVSDAARATNLGLAWGQFLIHPVFGLGLGGFKRYGLSLYGSDLLSLATADNMYLTALAETGVFGAAAFILVAVQLNGRRVRRGQPGGCAGTFVPLVVAAVVSLFFDSLFHDCMLYLFAVSLLIAMPPQGVRPAEESTAGTVNASRHTERAA